MSQDGFFDSSLEQTQTDHWLSPAHWATFLSCISHELLKQDHWPGLSTAYGCRLWEIHNKLYGITPIFDSCNWGRGCCKAVWSAPARQKNYTWEAFLVFESFTPKADLHHPVIFLVQFLAGTVLSYPIFQEGTNLTFVLPPLHIQGCFKMKILYHADFSRRFRKHLQPSRKMGLFA